MSLPEGGQQLLTQLQQQVSDLEDDKRQPTAEPSQQAAHAKALKVSGSKPGGRQGGPSSAGGSSSSGQHGANAATAAAAGGSLGLKPLRTQGSVGSLALPGTPGAGDARPTGAAAALLHSYSSNGGGRDSSGGKSSRLGSGSGSGEPGVEAPGSLLSADGKAASAGGGGVSYAPAQWEEGKQLQAKIESLR